MSVLSKGIPLRPLCPPWWSFLVIAALWGTRAAAQQPTFRSGTKLIVQTRSVKDKEGKPIEGLTARDFVVTEDGEPQAVSFVEYQRLENSSDAMPQAPAPVVIAAPRSASTPAAPVTEARIA